MDGGSQRRKVLGRLLPRYGLRHLALVVLVIAVVCSSAAFSELPPRAVPVQTNRELDLAVFGRGYFQLMQVETGETCYTRRGRFSIDPNGQLFIGRALDGWTLEPPIAIPSDYMSINISPAGRFVTGAGGRSTSVEIGAVSLAMFMNDEGLREIAPGIYAESDESGTPIVGPAGQNGFGYIHQGWIEERESGWKPDPLTMAMLLTCCVAVWTFFEVRTMREKFDTVISEIRDIQTDGGAE